jgi:hypothetical protein
MLEHIRSLKRTIGSNLKNQLADIDLAPRCRCHHHTGKSVENRSLVAAAMCPPYNKNMLVLLLMKTWSN